MQQQRSISKEIHSHIEKVVSEALKKQPEILKIFSAKIVSTYEIAREKNKEDANNRLMDLLAAIDCKCGNNGALLINEIVSDESVNPFVSYKKNFDLLVSPSYQKIFNAEKLKRYQDSGVKEKRMLSTNKYTCSKCKGTRCRYEDVQLRSIDEPPTRILECVGCGKIWKQK